MRKYLNKGYEMIKVLFEYIPEEIKVSLQDEIDKIGDNQSPEDLYHNVALSSGTTGSLAKIFELPFGLILKIKELNGHMGERKENE